MARYIEQGSEFSDMLDYVRFYLGKKKVITILLSGPPGTGKSFFLDCLAEELGDIDVVHCVGHPALTSLDTDGYDQIVGGDTVWNDGVIPRAIKLAASKGIAMLKIDEFNLMPLEIQPTFNTLTDYQSKYELSSKAGESYVIPEGSTLIVAITINEDIAGVMDIQDSVQSRVMVKEYIGYPEPKLEADIIQMRTGLRQKYGVVIATFAGELRNAVYVNDGSLPTVERPVTTRELISFADLLQVLPARKAFKYSVINKLTNDKADMATIESLADGFGLYSVLAKPKYGELQEGEVEESLPDEGEVEEITIDINDVSDSETGVKWIDGIPYVNGSTYPEIIDVALLNNSDKPLKCNRLRIVDVNEFPKKIDFYGSEYDVIAKHKKFPEGIWVAKILGTDNHLELVIKKKDGKLSTKNKSWIKFRVCQK